MLKCAIGEKIKLSLVYKGNVAEESSHFIELIEDSAHAHSL